MIGGTNLTPFFLASFFILAQSLSLYYTLSLPFLINRFKMPPLEVNILSFYKRSVVPPVQKHLFSLNNSLHDLRLLRIAHPLAAIYYRPAVPDVSPQHVFCIGHAFPH